MKRQFLALLLLLGTSPAQAQEGLVADLSSASIAVTTGFIGSSLTVFGALDQPAGSADDVVVALEGPLVPVIVHKKTRHYGLWVNGESITFNNVHSFYSLAATHPISLVMSLDELDAHQLSFEATPELIENGTDDFRSALIRIEKMEGLYSAQGGEVHLMAGRLFRADFNLPANVPIGAYQVHIAFVHGGSVVAERRLPMTIDEDGIAEVLKRTAFESPFTYAICSLAAIFSVAAAGALISRKET